MYTVSLEELGVVLMELELTQQHRGRSGGCSLGEMQCLT